MANRFKNNRIPSATALLFGSFILFLCSQMHGQLTGVKTIPGTYASVSAAATALNSQGVGPGGVIFEVAAGYTESNVMVKLDILNNQPTVTRPIVFRKAGVGPNPLLTAGVGNSPGDDGVIQIIGLNYITFDGIDVQENVANASPYPYMEFGYGLFFKGSNNPVGCQHITIKNCRISLNKSYNHSVGILVGEYYWYNVTGVFPTNFGGTISHNEFLSNTITNCYHGYVFKSHYSGEFMNEYNRIGKDSVSGLRSQIVNFGGGTDAAYGIFTMEENNLLIEDTYINNSGGVLGTGKMAGICNESQENFNVEVRRDTVALQGGGTTDSIVGIAVRGEYFQFGVPGKGNTVRIQDNLVQGCSFPTATTASFTAIELKMEASFGIISGNRILGNTYHGSSAWRGIYVPRLPHRIWIENNVVRGNQTLGNGSKGYGVTKLSRAGYSYVTDNQVDNNAAQGIGAAWVGIQSLGTTQVTMAAGSVITRNLVHDNTAGSGGTLGIYSAEDLGYFSIPLEVSHNRVYNLSSTGPTRGIIVDRGHQVDIHHNELFGLEANGSQSVVGIQSGYNQALGVGPVEMRVHDNFVSDLRAPLFSGSNAAVGIRQGSSNHNSIFRTYHNTVYLNTGNLGAANYGTVGIYFESTHYIDEIRNNIVVNLSTPGTSSGNTIGIQRVSGFNGSTSNYNCVYVGPTSAQRLLFVDGINNYATLTAWRNGIAPQDQASISEMPPFVNIAVAPFDLHLQPGAVTGCESGGSLTRISDTDFDGEPHYNAPGFPVGPTPARASDIGADEFGGTLRDSAGPTITYVPLPRGRVALNRSLPRFATISDPSGIESAPGLRPRLYYKLSTHANVLLDNTSSTNGWKYVETADTLSPFGFTIDYTKLFGGAAPNNSYVQYFVVAQDTDATVMVGKRKATFATSPSSVNLVPAQFPVTGTVDQYQVIISNLFGVVNVGPGQSFTSLTNNGGIFQAINNGVVTGDITIQITGDLNAETGANALKEWAEEQAQGIYTVKIVPSAATLRMIQGSGGSSTLVRLDGAKRATIDGRFGGVGRYLLFRSTTNSANTMVFMNDAQHCTVRNCILESGCTSNLTSTLAGVITIGVTDPNNNGAPQGNDHNTIRENVVRNRTDTGARPNIGIYCYGKDIITGTNDSCQIVGNEIYDFWLDGYLDNYGIMVDEGNHGFVIDSNSIFQTAPRISFYGPVAMCGISVRSGTSLVNRGHVIRHNWIGGSAPYCGGNPWEFTNSTYNWYSYFHAIQLDMGIGITTTSDNIIRNLDISVAAPSGGPASFVAIAARRGYHEILRNRIGGSTGQDSLKARIYYCNEYDGIQGIALGDSLATLIGGTISNNVIGAFTAGAGSQYSFIRVEGISMAAKYNLLPMVAKSNLIGSLTTASSFNITSNSNSTIECMPISCHSTSGTIVVDSNTISNVTASAVGDINIAGIHAGRISETGLEVKIRGNLIRNIQNNAPNSNFEYALAGIALRHRGDSTLVASNSIEGLSLGSVQNATPKVFGIVNLRRAAAGKIAGNQVKRLENQSLVGTPSIQGIAVISGSGWEVSNNIVAIANGTHTNPVKLSGIVDAGFDHDIRCLYNTILISGSAASGSQGSAAMERMGPVTMYLRNNLLYNQRSGGTGGHFALSNRAAVPGDLWVANQSNYNTLIAPVAAKLCEWGAGVGYTFAQWKTASGGDVESYSDIATTVPSDSLFVNPAVGDLHIRQDRRACWYVNGKGIAGNYSDEIASDIDTSAVRSVIEGIPTDIGADEFQPDSGVSPIPAIASAAPAFNTTTHYTFAGRRLGSITWGNSGILPTLVEWRYYSSVPPPGAALSQNIRSYWELTPSGGSGYAYDLDSYYSIHEQASLADPMLHLGRQIGSTPWAYLAGNPQIGTLGKHFLRNALNNLGNFTLGIDSVSTPTIQALVLGGQGTISPAGLVTVSPYNDQTFTLTGTGCYVVDSIFVDGQYVGAPSTFTFTQVTTNHTIGVVFSVILSTPQVSISSQGQCPGAPLSVTASPVNGGPTPSYQWWYNGNPTGSNSNVLTLPTPQNGDQVWCVLTSNAPCLATSIDTSNVMVLNFVDTIAPTAVCQNATFTLGANGTGNLAFSNIDGGSSDACTISSAVVSPSAFTCSQVGIQMVTATLSDPSGNTSTCTVNVNVVASAVQGAITPILKSCGYHISCAGATDGSVTATPSGGCPPYTYQWSNGATTLTLSGLSAGTYQLTVTDAAGSTGVLTTTLVAPSPIQATFSNISASCVGDSTGAATATATGGNSCQPYSYSWNWQGQAGPNLTQAPAGSYVLVVADAQGCFNNFTLNVGSLPQPQPTISVSGNQFSANQVWTSYQWLLNGVPITGATAATFTASQPGNYSLLVSDANGCTGVSAVMVGSQLPLTAELDFSLWPNPARDEVKLSSTDPIHAPVEISITSINGTVLQTMLLPHLLAEVKLDIKGLSSGAYFISLKTRDKATTVRKLMIQ